LAHKLHGAPSSAISRAALKTANLFRPNRSDHEPEIYHLGGMKTISFDSSGNLTSLHPTYFYEKISIRTPNGEVFLYRDTLKPLVDKWIHDSKNGIFTGTFQEYIELNLDLTALDQLKVRYFSDEDRMKTRVRIHSRSLEQIGLDQLGTEMKVLPEGEYAFVLSQSIDDQGVTSKNLYAAIKGGTGAGKVQHSSFTRGGNVISSGLFSIGPNGTIEMVENYSGHYRPKKEELLAILTFLKEQGYDIAQCNVRYHLNDVAMFLSKFNPFGTHKEIYTRGDIFLATYSL
jgi:hypothetical protein